jgi:hypothetical protein
MHPAIPPPWILADQPEHQDADRAHSARPARARGPGPLRAPTRERIAVPAEHGIRTHHQAQSLEHIPREPVQENRQQRPVSRGEPHPVRTELPLQDQELVAQRKDLRVFSWLLIGSSRSSANTFAHRGRPVVAARSITMPQRFPVT